MSSTPRRTRSGSSASATSGVQPVLASTRIGPAKTARTASSVSMSAGPPTLILRAGKPAARRARSATTAGASMPSVKSVGGIVARQGDQLAHRQAEPLAGQVVEGDVDGALDRAVVADGGAHQPLGVLERRADVVDARRAGPSRSADSASSSSGATAAIVAGVSP